MVLFSVPAYTTVFYVTLAGADGADGADGGCLILNFMLQPFIVYIRCKTGYFWPFQNRQRCRF